MVLPVLTKGASRPEASRTAQPSASRPPPAVERSDHESWKKSSQSATLHSLINSISRDRNATNQLVALKPIPPTLGWCNWPPRRARRAMSTLHLGLPTGSEGRHHQEVRWSGSVNGRASPLSSRLQCQAAPGEKGLSFVAVDAPRPAG